MGKDKLGFAENFFLSGWLIDNYGKISEAILLSFVRVSVSRSFYCYSMNCHLFNAINDNLIPV